MVAFFSDGALVMIGKSNGEAAKLKNKMKNSRDRCFS
jgi:predicted ribosome quality control (RQC) complex YloA/Tae2 family protein